jgi:3-oxoacyl-[acyl-carrier-protein] synthase III
MVEQQNAYVTAMGCFLPGPPVANDDMEEILGAVHGVPSRLRTRILRSNRIKTRHYAMDREQRTTYENCELAALAAEACLSHAFIDHADVDMLAVGTTQSDLPVPGMASMVQTELGLGPCELLSTHGVCSAGIAALKSAVNQVRLGEKRNALVCASELTSRLLKRSRYEVAPADAVDFEAEFLRWMLSDGAGAALVQPRPRPRGLSLRVDWIEITSYAPDFDLCMSCGTADQASWSVESSRLRTDPVCDGSVSSGACGAQDRQASATHRRRTWQDYATCGDAERAGALLLRQNVRIFEGVLKVGAHAFLKLVEQGRIATDEIDHLLCHYSSHYFKPKIVDLFRMAGCMVPEERWFTNLYSKGNTGCASIFIMLDELFHSGRLQPGQVVLCMVPESARFMVAYMKMTVVEGAQWQS